MSDLEKEIEVIQVQQISSAIKYLLKRQLNPSGAKYFFLELLKIAQLQGEFLKDSYLNFNQVDNLKKRYDRTEKLLATLQSGRHSPSTSIKKSDNFEQEQNRQISQIIYDLLDEEISFEEGLIIFKEHLKVSLLKGKYHDPWSGKIDINYSDDVMERLYACDDLLNDFKERYREEEQKNREIEAQKQVKSEKITRPNYEIDKLRNKNTRINLTIPPKLLAREKYKEKIEREVFSRKEEVPGEESQDVKNSYGWSKFLENASENLVGGKEGENITIEDDQLGILDKLPVGQYKPSRELSEISGQRKSFVNPEVIIDLIKPEENECIFLPGQNGESSSEYPFKRDFFPSPLNYPVEKEDELYVPFETITSFSDISKIKNLSPLSLSLKDGMIFLLWEELFSGEIKLDRDKYNPRRGKNFNELIFMNLSKYYPVKM